MDLAWLTLLALLLVIAISCTTRLNPGVAAIVLAWLIASVVAPQFGVKLGEKAVAAGFPSELFLTLLGVSLLFGQAEANGTLAHVADTALTLVGGQRSLVPWMFFLLAAVLGSAGPGNIAIAGILAPVAMNAARQQAISPLLMAALVGHGAIASTVSPFTAAGVLTNERLAAVGVEHVAWQVYAWNFAANAIAAALAFVIFGGWRLRLPSANEASRPPASADSSSGFTTYHWVTLAVIGAVLTSVTLAKVPIGLAAFCGAALLVLLRVGDESAGFARVPWAVLIMVTGVSVLTSLLDRTGGSQRFASLIGQISTADTLAAIVALVTGVVSIYSSTTGVVLPAFLPLVKDFASLHEGVNPLSLALAVLVGGNLVDMSPLSTIGALCLAAFPNEVGRRRLFNQLLAWGFAMSLLGTAISWICF